MRTSTGKVCLSREDWNWEIMFDIFAGNNEILNGNLAIIETRMKTLLDRNNFALYSLNNINKIERI